ncbi:transposase DDE domain protein [Acinetobacter baumannii 99063]|uniref:Transposase DDE domain protein n=1 Tax=Acinetobacter baumannii 99063 TaxID=1310630 RepID=A0A009SW66_ACIBA|nr:transposase DDE domain protein [Acinetobacter baumannii 99063]
MGIDAETLQIRAIQLSTNNVSDSQVLGDLLDQIPQDEQIDSVYTDGAYDTKQCRQVIADRQAHAVIPPRKNAKPWKDTKISSLERNELLRTVKRLGRTFGRNGPAIIGEVWLKLRCIASNYWGINSVREILIAKSMRFMHV